MIHCVGNSHVNNFSNSEKLNMNFQNKYFKSYHIGPVTAYNFFENHIQSVNNMLNNIDKTNDWITIIVGEVDCRLHLPLQADRQNRLDSDVVNECINRFIRCYDILINNGYKVFCMGTQPSTTEGHNMNTADRPIYDSMERRNSICLLWDKYLKLECDKRNIKFISIYNYLVDENNITNMNYFQDYCHLIGSKSYPLIVDELIKNEIIKIEY